MNKEALLSIIVAARQIHYASNCISSVLNSDLVMSGSKDWDKLNWLDETLTDLENDVDVFVGRKIIDSAWFEKELSESK